MKSGKDFLIANPVAGGGRAREFALAVRDGLLAAGQEVELLWTEKQGDGRTLVGRAVERSADRVIACGDDGTLQEVASALAGTEIPMGLAPAGRCDDFARGLDLKRGLEPTLKTLTQGHPRPIDLGRAGDKYFCTVAATGFDAAASRFVDELNSPIKGKPLYIYGVLRVLMVYQPIRVRLTWDTGGFDGPIYMLSVGNTRSYGGNIKIVPQADPRDGLFDVCLVSPISRLKVLQLLPLALLTKHTGLAATTFFRTSRITIETPDPGEIWADGEYLIDSPTTLRTVPGAIRIVLDT